MAFDPNFNDGRASEARYEDGIKAAIKRNAAKGAFKRWCDEAEDNKRLSDWLRGVGEFACDGNELHPLCVGMYDGDFGDFLFGLCEQLEEWGKLSPRQTEVVRNAFARAEKRAETREQRKAEWAAEAASAPPVPDTQDRIEVTAEILSIKVVENMYGVQVKALYKTDAGYKLWGSLPRSIIGAEKGDRVQFTARVERSKDDKSFGFVSRPTKARIIS
jgi:hypothetical protein